MGLIATEGAPRALIRQAARDTGSVVAGLIAVFKTDKADVRMHAAGESTKQAMLHLCAISSMTSRLYPCLHRGLVASTCVVFLLQVCKLAVNCSPATRVVASAAGVVPCVCIYVCVCSCCRCVGVSGATCEWRTAYRAWCSGWTPAHTGGRGQFMR